MAKQLILISFIILALISSACAFEFVEAYQILIENKSDGRIMASDDSGKTWENLGKVLVPTSRRNKKGYTASQWVATGEVAATAINAIHIKSGSYKSIFSLLPIQFLKTPKNYRSYYNRTSSLYTDINVNEGIFGGKYSPVIGSKVLVNGADMPGEYFPKIGDKFTIIVKQPAKYPREMIIENIFQGKVYLIYPSGEEEVVGYVLNPVAGVGRFAGTKYLNAGRVRANHAGVIDVSTSVSGRVSGFQIVPSLHAESKEMRTTRTMNQWMVIGPASLEAESPHGKAPLFRGFLRPKYNEADIYADDWQEKFLSHFLVQAKIKGKWQPMPIMAMDPRGKLPDSANKFLQHVKAFRIIFPE